jgi:hypothetical protein
MIEPVKDPFFADLETLGNKINEIIETLNRLERSDKDEVDRLSRINVGNIRYYHEHIKKLEMILNVKYPDWEKELWL